MYNRFLKDEKGFTGLEAAIVLIAFVVVAAVFSYVMLGAGFFTTQKSQEVVHTGVTQASSSIAPAGDVIVHADATNGGTADEIIFYVTNTAGGTPVDLDKVLLTYTDDTYSVTEPYTTATLGTKGPVAVTTIPTPQATTGWGTGWLYAAIISNTVTADNMLASGEKYKVAIDLTTFIKNSGVTTPTLPGVNEKFTIQVKPDAGAVLSITKTLPAALAKDQYYPVY